MSKKIRLVALVGVVALAALALASLPALAQDDFNTVTPKLNVQKASTGILTYDRKYSNDHATPQPGLPGDRHQKPGGFNNARSNDTGGFGTSIVGSGGGAMTPKIDRVARSLRTTADRLR